MSLRSIPAVALVLVLASPIHAAITTQEEADRTAAVFEDNLTLDSSKVFTIKGAALTKDLATFRFTNGYLYLAKPMEGQNVAALFVGEGTAEFTPVRPMDKRCLELAMERRFSRKPAGGRFATPFKEAVIVSMDGSLDAILKSGASIAAPAEFSQAEEILKYRRAVLTGDVSGLNLAFAQKLAGLDMGPLQVEFKTPDFDWLTYSYSPGDQIEVSLFSREKLGMFFIPHPLIETHRSADFDPAGNYIADPIADQKNHFDTTHYRTLITIPDRNHFLVETEISLTSLIDGLGVLVFDLVNNIAGSRTTDNAKPVYVRKVADAAGADLRFVHLKNTLLVFPAAPLTKGQKYILNVNLDEETIIQYSSRHFQVVNTYPWFPQHGYNGGMYTTDWTIKAKKPLRATGSGKLIEEKEEAGFNVTRLAFDSAAQFPSLVFGEYEKHEDIYKPAEGGQEVALSTYSSRQAAFYVTVRNNDGDERIESFDVLVPPNKPKDVLAEAIQIIKLGESLFGPFPFPSLQIVQMSPGLGFGQAPPALVQLTGEAFMSQATIAELVDSKADFFHEFLSHEIAHQWWGHVIPWASDEDQWLSESFAEYTAALYIMQLQGQNRFQQKIAEWKKAAKSADSYAPIAWANNLKGQGSGGWRTQLLYHKGPYVVHMLRMQMGHDNWIKAMKNLMTKHRFQPITTDMLRREMEAVAGYKLDYFFDQWYRDTGIPTIDYSTDVRQADDGKWIATVKTSQRDKDKFKILSLPVFFHFGKDQVVTKNRPILKAEDTYQIKLPEKPQSITLDDFKTLLVDFVEQAAPGK